jgi:hypothetical protein
LRCNLGGTEGDLYTGKAEPRAAIDPADYGEKCQQINTAGLNFFTGTVIAFETIGLKDG